jgi:hypothetical protein
MRFDQEAVEVSGRTFIKEGQTDEEARWTNGDLAVCVRNDNGLFHARLEAPRCVVNAGSKHLTLAGAIAGLEHSGTIEWL